MSSNTKNLFESMTRRRVSCPQVTQQLWDTIKNIRNQGQVPTAERVAKLMLRDCGVNEEEVMRQLNHCVRDGLIEINKRTVKKGNLVGSHEDYKLPLLSLKTDDYDWYCFDCHRAGDVVCCSRPHCLRVYHMACISSTELPEGDFICHVCKMCEMTPDKFHMKRSKLNKLLGFTLQMLKSKYPLTLKDQRIPPPNKSMLVSDRLAQVLTPPVKAPPDEAEAWRTQLLIAREMNLTLIEDKIDRHRYRLLEEFHADALNIVHNMVLYNGVDSAVADVARQMLRDCVQDLVEIRQCVDCYRNSRGGKKKLWFCKPCRKPHDLVYAKQSGFPYWPAKVIKVNGDEYDVRFFGAQHMRASIPKVHIRPISVNIHTLQVKRSSAWNKACEELKKHEELLDKARVATNNFTKFHESSSSSEYESIDTEQEREMEKENKMRKLKVIMEKHNAVLLKQKNKRRRSSSVVPAVKAAEKAAPAVRPGGGAKKRGRTPKGGATDSRATKRKLKREIYDFSSDSMDSFNFNNSSKNDNAPKKNNDEIFDELLKSEADKCKPTSKPDANKEDSKDGKGRKWLDGDTVRKLTKRNTRKGRKGSDSWDSSDDEDDEGKSNVKKVKNKSETFDSSTVSSVDTFEPRKRGGAAKKNGTTIFGIKEQNQDLTFERIARGGQDRVSKDKSSMKKIYTSSSEADDESELSSKEASDSDLSSKNKKSKSKKVPTRNSTSKKTESPKVTENLNSKPEPNTSDSDSESVKNSKSTKKVKNILNTVKKSSADKKGATNKSKKKMESSGSEGEGAEDEDKDKPKVKKKSPAKPAKPAKPETKVKLPLDRVIKGKNQSNAEERNDSSDSETPLSANSKGTRSKTKDTSESTDMETPVPKKQLTRSSTKKDSDLETKGTKGKTKEVEKPVKRVSQRKSGRGTDSKAETTNATKKSNAAKGTDKEADSSDSEAPLSRKTDLNEGKEDMAEMREMFKKYISKLDIKDEEIKEEVSDRKKYESSDEDSPLNKKEEIKNEGSESDGSEADKKNKKTTKKSKTELLEEKVQKIKKQKNMVEDKKQKEGRKKEESKEKEKEETVVSSSSQEPITKSVAVQTMRSGEERIPNECADLQQKTERVGELEKELQAQLGANKLLEVELNKARVLLDRLRNDHEEELADLNTKHAMNVSEIKKKQWCYNCETEAIYHCCWNTAYCSVECQQAHWQSEHKRVCRRKR